MIKVKKVIELTDRFDRTFEVELCDRTIYFTEDYILKLAISLEDLAELVNLLKRETSDA